MAGLVFMDGMFFFSFVSVWVVYQIDFVPMLMHLF